MPTKYVAFAFLAEDRSALVEALASHPAARADATDEGTDRFPMTLDGATCQVEIGCDHGTVAFDSAHGDLAATVAQDLLAAAGTVFGTCC